LIGLFLLWVILSVRLIFAFFCKTHVFPNHRSNFWVLLFAPIVFLDVGVSCFYLI
jgi:hypothetical protein